MKLENPTPNTYAMPKYYARLAIRTDRVGKSGFAPIFMWVTLDGKKFRINLNVSAPADNWNAERQTVSASKHFDQQQADQLNDLLDSELRKAKNIFYEYRMRSRPLTPELFKRLFVQGENKNSFHEWVDREIKKLEGVRGKKTISQYRVTFRKLRQFRPNLSFYDLTVELPTEFDHWLIKTCKLDALNTRAKYHKHLKTFTRSLARSQEADIPNIYEHFRIRQTKAKRIFLTNTEVKKLIDLYDSRTLSPHIHKALARFLFSCHCGGLRCADLDRVGWSDIDDGFLCFYPEKTKHIDKLIEVPLSKDALRYVQNPTGCFFDPLSNQNYNQYLKVVARVAGLSKNLTTHVARHTFATNYLVAGGRREVLQKILGHADSETTDVYVHTTRQHLRDELHILKKMY